MDWITLATPLFAFLGVIVAEWVKLKSKKLDVTSGKAIQECAVKHSDRLDKVKGEFNARLDAIDNSLADIKSEQLRIALNVAQLQKDQAKYNNVIERTYVLENKVAVLDNRESVSEHRLTDLEKENKL